LMVPAGGIEPTA